MVPIAKGKRHDTSAPMEIGMATKEDSENASQEGDQRIIDLALQTVLQRSWQRKVELLAKVSIGTRREAKVAKMEERTHSRKAVARKGGKGQREGWQR